MTGVSSHVGAPSPSHRISSVTPLLPQPFSVRAWTLVDKLTKNTRQMSQAMTLESVNLKSRQQKSYVVPPSRGRLHLLAMQPLSDGKVSVAYTTDGGCDPFGPAAPFDPPAGGPMPMFRESLCIAVLPANPDKQDPAQR